MSHAHTLAEWLSEWVGGWICVCVVGEWECLDFNVALSSSGENFSLFHFTISRFQVTGHFKTSALDNTKMALTTTRPKFPYIYVTNVQKSQISCHFLYDHQFSRCKNQKCRKWHQDDFAYLTVHSTLHTLSTYLRGPKFCPFHPKTTCFKETNLLKIEKIQNPQNDFRLI